MKKRKKREEQLRINEQIRYPEVKVLNDDGSMLGVMSSYDALKKANSLNFDLVEISGNSKPPIVKITDYGKFKYEKKKKDRDIKAKTKLTETKTIQIKPGTGDGDLSLKAKNISTWLKEGNRVKLDLFLRGRSKYMEENFLKQRLNRILLLVTENYKIADGPKKSPKGMTMILEKSNKKSLSSEDNKKPTKKSKDKNA